jgi:hypothetical protein
VSWKNRVGFAAAQLVRLAALTRHAPQRGLRPTEIDLLSEVYGEAVNYERVRIRALVRGLLAIGRRAFVIENTLFIPPQFLPLLPQVLVHEICHIWQFQHGGHAYIADSLHAQLLGDGYQLEKGLNEGRAWHQLNCEQQATLLEEAWAQRAFDGRPFVVGGVDRSEALRAAITEVRAGRGAQFQG